MFVALGLVEVALEQPSLVVVVMVASAFVATHTAAVVASAFAATYTAAVVVACASVATGTVAVASFQAVGPWVP